MRILVVEDEKAIREILTERLFEEGYSIDAAEDGVMALDFLAAADYDAVVLDIMLPRLSGLSVLKQMRQEGKKTPVLLLTARSSVEDRVTGLDSGADDYLVKPFSFEELLARIRVILRRKSEGTASSLLAVGDLTLDLNTRKVCRGERGIRLTAKEYAVLEYFMYNKGIVLNREKIEQHIWNYEYEGDSNVIDVYIRCLRKKLEAGGESRLIYTVRGAGYVMKEEE
jgi:two-component system copper resistance phosphate regulon response regulator CusR